MLFAFYKLFQSNHKDPKIIEIYFRINMAT